MSKCRSCCKRGPPQTGFGGLALTGVALDVLSASQGPYIPISLAYLRIPGWPRSPSERKRSMSRLCETAGSHYTATYYGATLTLAGRAPARSTRHYEQRSIAQKAH